MGVVHLGDGVVLTAGNSVTLAVTETRTWEHHEIAMVAVIVGVPEKAMAQFLARRAASACAVLLFGVWFARRTAAGALMRVGSTPGGPASLRSRSRDGARSIGSSRQGPARSSTASERAPERGWRNPARSDRAAGYWANAGKKGHVRRLRSFHDVPGRRLGGSPALRYRCLGEGPRTGRARREVSLGLGP